MAGESGRIHFRRLSVNDGMSQNTVLALTQDHNGKIWVGTIDGLNWYDGYRFAPLYKDLNDSTSLSNNHVYSLCTDAEGTVWVGTLTGLSRYNIVGNNFTNYSLPEGLPVQIFAIEDLSDKGQLLLGTSNGLVVFDKKTGYMNLHPHLQGTTIYSICQINEGILLGSSSGIYHYRPQDNSVVRILPELKNEAISSVVYDPRKRTCWLGSFINGVYSMDEKFQIKEHYLYNDRQRQSPFESVRTLAQDDKGRIWIGTINALFILEPETGTIDKYTFSHEDENSLGHNSVRSILKDNQGGIWVGTFYGGLNYYHPMAPAFDTMTYSAYKNSISDNTVSCIVEDSRTGNLWIGTNDGGLNEYDRKKNHFTVYRANRNNPRALQSDNIKCALPDGNGVYIGSHGGGLSYLSGTGGQIENYTFPNAVSFNNSCYSLLDGKDGTLWVGSIIGLHRFDKKTKKLSLHPLAQKYPRLNSVLISVLYRDSKDRIWIGTEESLFVYANGKLEEWKDYTSKTPSLIQAFCIQEDSNQHIWIGSSVGLYKSPDGSTNNQARYSTKDGLPNNFIYGVLEDGRGRLWITTNRGLSCFDPSEQTFLNYTVLDGLSHGQFNTYGACKTQDGIFFLGSLKGITYFNPYEFVDNPFSPNAVVTGATILNQPVVDIKDGVSKYFQASNGRLLGMSFPSNRKLFSIRFSVINYLSGRRNLFAYKLEGFDEDWVSSAQAISQRGATYSNLPPGKYIFKVKACNNNGRWSLTPTEFFVHITPMWYQTWWAKSIFVLLILGGIAFILYFFIARAKMKMQMQIDHLERNKIEEISQEKVRFYINMSHELRTPLSLILAPLEELTEEKNKFDVPVQQKLSYVYRNGRKLLHLVNQLLDFRKAESGALPIHVAMNDVDELAGNVFAMFRENAQKRNITYQFHSDLNGSPLPIDKTYVEMMLTNLLSNAFKFTPNGGEITFSLWKKEHSFGFSIKDSGIGIPPEKLSRIFERFYQANEDRKGSGIGLSLVKCLVEKHHGSISVDSKPGQGSDFVIELPSDIQEFSPAEIVSRQEDNNSEWQTSSFATETMAEDGEFPVIDPSAGQDGQEEEQSPNDITETILLVDDNKEMVDYLKNNFKSKYITLTAGNGEEALAILKEQKVDIVLSDVMMPGIDGIKLCELIKKNMQTCHIPVILLSAKGSIEAQTAGIRIGADDYIPKPFSMNLLKGKINNILKAKQRLRHYYSDTIDIDTAKMTSNTLDEEFMSKAIQIVEENIDDENFTADDLAEKLFMSRSSLYLKMNSVSGEPPANFIRRIRFNKACKLLLEGRYSISEISSKVGFSSASYFSTSFKKYMGCLPSDYVKNQGKKRES
ncbi:hybrid sensor histidine kinase/response regulator transcription factor [uncultured Bacteroides sp.]|uniref:hybrid sensor histidine kinase/response regulator transcription factor n=1 Tax=uncultured Bacteroides sp. TaxID=162156 RepID=UPI0026751B8A|nr:hybrid sensor histidine kinase/response regulator transcription factor [uncultured Bacteroides sp.]